MGLGPARCFKKMALLDNSLPFFLAELQRTLSNLSTLLASHDGSTITPPKLNPTQPPLPCVLHSTPAAVPSAPVHPLASDPFVSWRPVHSTSLGKSFVETASLDPLSSRAASQIHHQPVTFHPPPFHSTRDLTAIDRLRSKLKSLSSLSKKGSLVYLRCGDSGHLARSCHNNALVCFRIS